jgi:putative DNA-invertase from lambdoid prophage Rac
MARYGYARVSTDAQVNDPQIFALQSEGVETIVTEVISGSVPARVRPQLSELLGKLKRGVILLTEPAGRGRQYGRGASGSPWA